MILINKMKLETGALQDDTHPMHSFAKEYDTGVKYLKRTYGDSIRFIRPGYPRHSAGVDAKGKPVPKMAKQTPPMILPLQAEVVGKTGTEVWACSLGSPQLLPNGLWDIGSKRSLMIGENYTVNLKTQPDLAFFLYYKSPMYGTLLKVDDPTAKAREDGDRERAELELQTALYGRLSDEKELRVICQSWGIRGADKKHPDVLRKELRGVVKSGDKAKKRDATARGTAELLTDLKITDMVRLRSFVMQGMDNKKINWMPDGKYKIGERELCKVPVSEIKENFTYLCNHLGNAANRDKLKNVISDLADKEYLDGISDDKQFFWLARMLDLPIEFKKKEEIREIVYSALITV